MHSSRACGKLYYNFMVGLCTLPQFDAGLDVLGQFGQENPRLFKDSMNKKIGCPHMLNCTTDDHNDTLHTYLIKKSLP